MEFKHNTFIPMDDEYKTDGKKEHSDKRFDCYKNEGRYIASGNSYVIKNFIMKFKTLCAKRIELEREKIFNSEEFNNSGLSIDMFIAKKLYSKTDKKFFIDELKFDKYLDIEKDLHSIAELRLINTAFNYYLNYILGPNPKFTNQATTIDKLIIPSDTLETLVGIMLNLLVEHELFKSGYNITGLNQNINLLYESTPVNLLTIEENVNVFFTLQSKYRQYIGRLITKDLKYTGIIYDFIKLLINEECRDVTYKVIELWTKEFEKNLEQLKTPIQQDKIETKELKPEKELTKEEFLEELKDNVIAMTGIVASKTNFKWSDIKDELIELIKKV